MSFSQEMKDFLSAYKTGQDINASKTDQEYKQQLGKQSAATTDSITKKTARDNDPDTLDLEDKQARAKLSLTNEQIKNAGSNRAYMGALTDRVRSGNISGAQPYDGVTGNLPYDPASGPVAPGGTAPMGTIPLPPRDDLYKEGGRIPSYAGGGAIPDNSKDDDGDDDTEGPGDTDVSARRRTPGVPGNPIMAMPGMGINGVVSPALIHDAVKGGYTHLIQSAGLHGGVRSARQQAAARALAQGVGALSPQEMRMAGDAVDPQHKLSQSQRNMAALGSVYQYWVKQGDPDRARLVAAQMLQHMRLASQQYAAIAAHAAEQGNMDLAAKAGVQAYANVPDGKDMMITADPKTGQLAYHYTDANGKTIDKNLISPQDFAAKAMGLARGGFDQALLTAAGQNEDATAATGKATKDKGPKGDKVMDMKNRDEMLTSAVSDAQQQWQKANKGKDIDPTYWSSVQDNATHIMQQNPNVTPHEAINAAVELSTTSGGNPAPTFSTTSENGLNTVKLKSGNKIQLDDDHFNAIMDQRAANIKAGQDAEAKATADKAASDARYGRIKDGAAKVGGAIADDARQFGGEVMNAIPDEMKQRARAIPQEVGQAWEDYGKPAVRALADPNINFGTLTTAIGHGVQQGVNAAMAALRGGSTAQAAPAPQQQDPSGAIPASSDDPYQFGG